MAEALGNRCFLQVCMCLSDELCCAVGYCCALLGNGSQLGNHLQWKKYRRFQCAEQRSHAAALTALSFSVCVCGGESGKPCFLLGFVL